MEDRKNVLLQQAADALRPQRRGKTSPIDKDVLDSALEELAGFENLDDHQTASQIVQLLESPPSLWRRLWPLWRLLAQVGLAVVVIGLVAALGFLAFRFLVQPQLDELRSGLEQAQQQLSDQEADLDALEHDSCLAAARAQKVDGELQSLREAIDGLSSELESMRLISPTPTPAEPAGAEPSPSPSAAPGAPETPVATETPVPSTLVSEQPIEAAMASGGPWTIRAGPGTQLRKLATDAQPGYEVMLFGQVTEGLWRLGCCYNKQFFWAGSLDGELLIQTDAPQGKIPRILMPALGEGARDEWETDVLDGLESHFRSVAETHDLSVRWSLVEPGTGEIVVEAWVPSDWSTAAVTYAVSEQVVSATSETLLEPIQGTGSLDQSTLTDKPGFFPIGRYRPSDEADTVVIRLVTASPGAQAPDEGAHVALGPLRIVRVEEE